MVRRSKNELPAKKPQALSASTRTSSAAAVAEQPTPIPYTPPTIFRKLFNLKLGIVVMAAAAIAVAVWRNATHSASAATPTSIEGGDWLRESTEGSDPGVEMSRHLVLYKPSLAATDCRIEFDWTVASGDLGMAFRAKDLGNYYAVRLKVVPGATPTLAAEYFSVYQFTESPHKEKVLVFSRNDPTLRVRLDVFGPTFTLYLQDNATEYWTDPRLTSGAIGFFEEGDRTPEIRAVRMSFPEHSGLLGEFLAGGPIFRMFGPRILPGGAQASSKGGF